MRYCELTAERGDYKEAQQLLSELAKSCRLPDGSDDPKKGAELLGVSLDDLITDCIMGMRTVAKEIGLDGGVAG